MRVVGVKLKQTEKLPFLITQATMSSSFPPSLINCFFHFTWYYFFSSSLDLILVVRKKLVLGRCRYDNRSCSASKSCIFYIFFVKFSFLFVQKAKVAVFFYTFGIVRLSVKLTLFITH